MLKRVTITLGLIICLLLLILLLALYLVVSTERGSLWILDAATDRVTGLSYTQASGNLINGFRFSELRWFLKRSLNEDGVVIEKTTELLLRDASLRWSFIDLLANQFTIEQLHVGSFDIINSGQSSQKEPILPLIWLPITIALKDAAIDQFTVKRRLSETEPLQNMVVITDVHATFSVKETTWQFEHLSLDVSGFKVVTGGTFTSATEYALNITGSVLNETKNVELIFSSIGPLRKLPTLLTIARPYSLKAQVDINPFQWTSLLEGTASVEHLINERIPESSNIKFEKAAVSFHGSLTDIKFNVTGTAHSPYGEQPQPFFVNGVWHNTQLIDVEEISVSLLNGTIAGQGKLSIVNGVELNLDLSLNNIAASQLNIIPKTVTLSSVSGTISLLVQALDSNKTNNANKEIKWRLENIDLSTLLNNQQSMMSGSLIGAQTSAQNIYLQFTQGENSASIIGEIGRNHEITIYADVKNVASVVPQVAGDIKGEMQVRFLSESLSLVDAKGAFFAERLSTGDLSANKTQVNWSAQQWKGLTDAKSATIQMSVDTITKPDNSLLGSKVEMVWLISERTQNLEIRGKSLGAYDFNLDCHAERERIRQWEGQCEKGEFTTAFNQEELKWKLSNAISFSFVPHLNKLQIDNLQINSFCWQSSTGKACLDNTVALPINSEKIALSFAAIPWSWLSGFLPSSLELQGQISGNVSLNQTKQPGESAWYAFFDIASYEGIVTVNNKENEPLALVIKQISLKGHWSLRDVSGALTVVMADGGLVNADFSLDEGVDILNGNLKGRLTVKQFQLQILDAYLEATDELKGKFEADSIFGGTIAKPDIVGSFAVRDGSYATKILPTELKDIVVDGQFEQTKATMNGSFATPDGVGLLYGTLDWKHSQWSAIFNLKSDGMLLTPNPRSKVWVKPQISIIAFPGKVDIRGDILVPKAKIEMKDLPEVIATKSPDVILLDQPERSQTWQYKTDVNLRLGDNINFKGFGFEGKLIGQVKIQQSNEIPLTALGGIQLKKGTYTAFGQTLTIQQGNLTFAELVENPDINLKATRDDIEDGTVVGLNVKGRAKEPVITLFSSPEMSDQRRLSYLLTGKPPGTEDFNSKSMLGRAAIGLSLSQSEGSVARAVNKIGVEDFQMGAASSGEESGELLLSGRINERLYVQYGLDVFEKISRVLLRYQLKQGLFLEAASGKVNSLDMLFTFDRQ